MKERMKYMEDLISNVDAINFGRRKLQEIPEMSIEEAKELKEEMEVWCTSRKYTIFMPAVRFFQDKVLPKLNNKIQEGE